MSDLSHPQKLREWKNEEGWIMVKRTIFNHAAWRPDVWGLTALLVQGTISLWRSIVRALEWLGLIGSTKPWKDYVVRGSKNDVVSSGVQVGYLGQRKNTSSLSQETQQGQEELQHGFISQMSLNEFGWVLLALWPLFSSWKTEGHLLYCAHFVLLANKLFRINTFYFSSAKSRNCSC